MVNAKLIGGFIRDNRKLLNLTQKELATKLKVSNSLISLWEKGELEVEEKFHKKLADIFNVSILEFQAGSKYNITSIRVKFPKFTFYTYMANLIYHILIIISMFLPIIKVGNCSYLRLPDETIFFAKIANKSIFNITNSYYNIFIVRIIFVLNFILIIFYLIKYFSNKIAFNLLFILSATFIIIFYISLHCFSFIYTIMPILYIFIIYLNINYVKKENELYMKEKNRIMMLVRNE